VESFLAGEVLGIVYRISDVGFRISGVSVDVARAGGWLKAPEIRHLTSEIL
jgi:hypothetical protein